MKMTLGKSIARKSDGSLAGAEMRLARTDALHHAAAFRSAFTLLEMLVVVAIIGIIASVALPRLKGFGKSNNVTTAARQLLDDISAARQKAMATRSTVYMVFIPPRYLEDPNYTKLSPLGRKQADKLITGQYTSYAMMSLRSVGDQPGRPRARYLTPWKHLPEGTFIPIHKYSNSVIDISVTNYNRVTSENVVTTNRVYPFLWTNAFPFPSIDAGTNFWLPYIAFSPSGQLVSRQNPNQDFDYIPLAQGSLLYGRDPNTGLLYPDPDINETPPGNWTNDFNLVQIDWLTGRAKVRRLEIQ